MRLLRIARLRTAKKRQIPGRPKSLALRACHPFHSIQFQIPLTAPGPGPAERMPRPFMALRFEV